MKVIRRARKAKQSTLEDDYIVHHIPFKRPVDPTLFAYFVSTHALIATGDSFEATKEVVVRCFRLDPREWDPPQETRV